MTKFSLTLLDIFTGYLVSAISPSIQVATGVGPPLIMPFMLFGGFFLKDKYVLINFVGVAFFTLLI